MIRFMAPAPKTCAACGRPTTTPRFGLCFGCYQRARRGHTIEGSCAVCGLADKRMVRRHKLADGWTVLCANHAAVAGRRPLKLEQLQAELAPSPGDRRQGTERRTADRRGHSERRVAVAVDEWLLEQDRRQDERRGQCGCL